MPPDDKDDTVRLKPAAPPPAGASGRPDASRRPLLLGLGGLLVAAGIGAALVLRPGGAPVEPPPPAGLAQVAPAAAPVSAPVAAPVPPPALAAAPPPAVHGPPGGLTPAAAVAPAPAPRAPAIPASLPVPPPPRLPVATEAAILANRAPELTIRRLAENPAVVVLDFPTLAEQARSLNRVAALVEKSGLPRDRVLDDSALESAVNAAGGNADTFYYGHNYRAEDLARFFTLADRDGVRLTPEEQRLRSLVTELGWMQPGAKGALVSVPHEGVESWLDARARAAMLRHELSHGEFFTNPAYAAATWTFWRELLTEEERQRFRKLLADSSYDPSIEEVMANEAQAFLFHTPDERFFAPSMVGLSPERARALRHAFIALMPQGWLRSAMTAQRTPAAATP